MPNRPLRSGAPSAGRRVVSGRKSTFTGYIPSTKGGNDYRLIAYESLLERDYILHLEDDDDIVAYRDRDRAYPWEDASGNVHDWHPDFTLTTRADRRICVEVKPWAVIEKKDLLPSFALIAKAMKDVHGFDEFRLVTDREIRQPFRLYNLEILHSARLDREIEGSGFAVRQAFVEETPTTIGGLRRRLAASRIGFWSVCRLIADGTAALDDSHAPIEDRSILDWSDPS
ncbi:MAG TPA: hypothetical protein ENH55_23260 [Aurantimonas coralicida]|uniref:TnsA endonuclease N-terminal domain-containing protein n=2 Tax=root TaxID=1 RepID=A0A9C9TIY0_9HYPH|nr:hypothetical protein [Aurantimonas coralicida]HEU02298.1 hypothetical protein [Aurantimonas coralicida]